MSFEVTPESFVPIERLPPLAAGVYIFYDEGDQPLYVGQSGCVHARIAQHRRKKWYKDVSRIVAYPEGSGEERLVLETLMILRLRPRHNRAIKIGLTTDGRLYEIQFVRGKRSK